MVNEINPYAATSVAETIAPPAVSQPVPASQGRRLLNLLIDYFATSCLQVVVGVILIVLWGEERVLALQGLPEFLITLVIILSYYIFFEATTSRTLGKLLTGTIVVNEQGGKPTFKQILGRSFARLIPFEAFSFLKSPPRGLHDSLAKTYVIRAS